MVPPASGSSGCGKQHLTIVAQPTRYPAIADYALIGDCRGAALVSRAGSIDWLCWPRFDSPAVFAALLDQERGGRWRIAPTDLHDNDVHNNGTRNITRRYVGESNGLATRFECAGGAAVLTDLRPAASEEFKDAHLVPDHEIVRQIECERGEVEFELEFAPRADFGRKPLRLRISGCLGICAHSGRGTYWLRGSVPISLGELGDAHARFRLRAGESAQFSLTYSEDAPAVLTALGEPVRAAIARSVAWWEQWVGRVRYDGPARDAVIRSALALKLMSYAPSGAIIAAPTTSLPERIGGDLNWDYRSCWLRDAALTVRALLGLGFGRYVAEHWQQPDEGIWEPRDGREHHTHSRLLCWTALDRLVTLAERGIVNGAPVAAFRRERERIACNLHERAWNPQRNAYAARLGGDKMDAALLLLPWYGFEHADSPRMRGTYRQLRQQLGAGELIYRYRPNGGEGAFGICSFWEAEYLALGGGSLPDATELFERLLRLRNDVGLLAEEYDPATGDALGNFPQAFTHVGLISAALAIADRAAGRRTLEHREHGAGAQHARSSSAPSETAPQTEVA